MDLGVKIITMTEEIEREYKGIWVIESMCKLIISDVVYNRLEEATNSSTRLIDNLIPAITLENNIRALVTKY